MGALRRRDRDWAGAAAVCVAETGEGRSHARAGWEAAGRWGSWACLRRRIAPSGGDAFFGGEWVCVEPFWDPGVGGGVGKEGSRRVAHRSTLRGGE